MTMFSTAEAAALMPGATLEGAADVAIERVWTDTRSARPGDLFVALSGEHFDAHDFLDRAAAAGVAAAVVARPAVQVGPGVPLLRVADTRAALAALAHGWRCRFTLPLVAVTGSNGKTTVKEMIASIFAAAVGAEARLATAGNMNNDIGVPLTLLRLQAAHRLAVLELGMNHPGETAALARCAAPSVVLVNNAQREHQEFMASVEAVALEHATAIHALTDAGVAVFPADDAYTSIWRVAATGCRSIEFVLDEAAEGDAVDAAEAAEATARHRSAAAAGSGGNEDDAAHVRELVSGRFVGAHAGRVGQRIAVTTPAGAFETTLRIPGRHNARNALAATACALGAGVPLAAIARGLDAFEPVRGRLRTLSANAPGIAGASIIDDTYNANPDSMRAAIDVLAAAAAPRLLVVGDMGEVGDQGPAFHREIGDYARAHGIERMFAIGTAMRDACAAFGPQATHFDSAAELIAALLDAGLDERASVLVKGSNFMNMMRVVDALVRPAGGPESSGPAGAH